MVAGATTFPPVQGALWVLGSGINLNLWQQRRENHTTGLAPVEMHPYSRYAVLPPEGEVLATLCLDVLMRTKI